MRQGSFFEQTEINQYQPLADRMRPTSLDDYWGQEHLIGQGQLLRKLIDQDTLGSMIFWGPPGVGKTTLARIIAHQTKARFVSFSAVTSGIKEIKQLMSQASMERLIVFIDEIHRFNKAQQDAFLPFVEKGAIILIGATTENPSFEVNAALLSRCRVFVLQALSQEDLVHIMKRAIETALSGLEITESQLAIIAEYAAGDARFCLNTLEVVANNAEHQVVSDELLAQCLQRRSLNYDKKGDGHYDIISALHKSMRNSDVQASIYWLARMLEAGEDPLYIARRIVRFASEDIGLADSRALEICVACYQACHYLGMPECNVHLTHAVTYCALAPKSNALEKAYFAARDDALATGDLAVPHHLRNAPTALMAELGHGKGYQYAHDYAGHITAMVCLPKGLEDRVYYDPSDQGSEKKVALRLAQIQQQKERLK